MEFRTPVQAPEYPFRITPDSPGLVLGSCFAEHIGGWLRDGKMTVEVNPFGVLYNPASIARGLQRLSAAEPFRTDELFQYNGLWHSSMHHGSYSGPVLEIVLDGINAALKQGAAALQQARYLMLTLGTAWVYERQGSVVANCHKLPAREFVRRRMSVSEIVAALAEQIELLPDKQIVLTVSPVIHRGDGLVENQLSKSTLIVAAHELTARDPGRVHYYPAYEILTGELRDYRYYADDMCHPSLLAVEYIREHFAGTLLTPEAVALIASASELRRAMQHRPLHSDAPEYQRFRAKMQQKAEALQQRYKNADFAEELRFFG